MVETQTLEAVKSEGFVTVERTVLEELVEKNSLNIKEVELFKAVDCWAEKECEMQGLVCQGFLKRKALGERIVKGIRFPAMTEREFVDIVLDSEILTSSETNHMIKYYNSVLDNPVGFHVAKRTRRTNVISNFASLSSRWFYFTILLIQIVYFLTMPETHSDLQFAPLEAIIVNMHG